MGWTEVGMEMQVSTRTVSVDAERDPGPRLDPGIQTDTHTRQCVTSAREWDQEEPRMLVLTLPLRKWLGDLGKIISPLWTSVFSPVKWRAWSGPADRADWKRPWRSHTPFLPGVMGGNCPPEKGNEVPRSRGCLSWPSESQDQLSRLQLLCSGEEL